MQELLKNKNIRDKNQIYYSITIRTSSHNPSDPIKLSIATAERLQKCLDHVGKLTRSKPWRTKRGGEHHIATDHGPKVQRKLLTSHPGSIHGGEETPGGRPPLRQGAGKRSAGAPDLGSAAAAEQRRDREKGFCLEGFSSRRIYRRRVAARGATRGPGTPLARPAPGARHQGAWAPGGGPLAPLRFIRKVPLR